MADGLREALEQMGLGDLYDVFKANDIDTDTISDLTEDDLRELGLSMGQRKRVLRARDAMQGGQPATTDASDQTVAAPRPPAPEVAPRAERRQLTTLFCDLVGSTHLATVLDPEDLREVIEAYQAMCGAVIRAHAGHIAYSQGDGVMAYFGFPRAGEDDPERAVRAGFEIVERLRDLKTDSPEPLAVRIGIATGVVVVGESRDPSFGEGMVVGETPNLAARLQAVAEPNDVVVAETTRRLCGAQFEYESRGDLELKGFPAPVTVYRVLGESGAQNRFEARARSGLNPIIGRDPELDALLGLWRRTRAGTGQIALISGDPGIGKSRLARAFIESVAGDEPRVLRWYCSAHLTNRALHPVVRALETLEGLARPVPARARLAALEQLIAEAPLLGPGDVPFMADLLGIEGTARPDLDAPTRARRTYDALVRAVVGEAEAGPVLVLVEDAHWADVATLDLIGHLLDRIVGLPVMLLVTARPEFAPPWPIEDRGMVVSLEALDATEGSRLVELVVRERVLPHAVVRAILEKAAGVPFFVEELTRTLLDSLLDPAQVGNPLAALSIPATLQDSLMARLDRLGEAKELALIGSVIGREFTAAMLRVVAPEHPDLEGGLRRLCESGLAYEGGRSGGRAIIFHHALVQDAAYESILRRRRREIHRAVAQAMLAGDPAFMGAEPEVIARHCTGGDLPAEAVAHWLEAGLHALDKAAAGPALVYLRSALEQLERTPYDEARSATELRIQMALAPAAMAIYGWAAKDVEVTCRRASDLAQAVGDGGALFGATWGLWTNYFLRGEMEPALETARSVEAMATAAGDPVLMVAAHHAVGFTLYFRGELDAALKRAEAGHALFREESERQIVRMFQFSSTTALHGFAAASLWKMDRETEADAALERALDLTRTLAHAPSLAFCYAFNAMLLLHRRDWSRLRDYAQRGARLSADEDFRMWLPLCQLLLGLCDAAEGQLDKGLAVALDAFERFAETGTVNCQSHLHAPIGEMLIRAGQAGEASRRLDEMIESALRRSELVYLSELYRVRGLARHALGEREAALTDLRTACEVARSQEAVTLLRRAEDDLRAMLAAAGIREHDAAKLVAAPSGEEA